MKKLPKAFTKAREENREEEHTHDHNHNGHNQWGGGRKFDEAPRQSLDAFLGRTQMDFHRIQQRRMSQVHLKEMMRECQRGTCGVVVCEHGEDRMHGFVFLKGSCSYMLGLLSLILCTLPIQIPGSKRSL